jgi:hypothetical protein
MERSNVCFKLIPSNLTWIKFFFSRGVGGNEWNGQSIERSFFVPSPRHRRNLVYSHLAMYFDPARTCREGGKKKKMRANLFVCVRVSDSNIYTGYGTGQQHRPPLCVCVCVCWADDDDHGNEGRAEIEVAPTGKSSSSSSSSSSKRFKDQLRKKKFLVFSSCFLNFFLVFCLHELLLL